MSCLIEIMLTSIAKCRLGLFATRLQRVRLFGLRLQHTFSVKDESTRIPLTPKLLGLSGSTPFAKRNLSFSKDSFLSLEQLRRCAWHQSLRRGFYLYKLDMVGLLVGIYLIAHNKD